MQLSFDRVLTEDRGETNDAGVWSITRGPGRGFRWEGFYTGPHALGPEQLAAATSALLGLTPEEVAGAAAAGLCPQVGEGATPSIVLHSATPGNRSLEADLADAESGHTPDDVATYVEARSVSLARPGDLVVGRTAPWRLAAELAGIERVEIPRLEFYYLSQAIIQLAIDQGDDAPALHRLAAALRKRPDTVVRLYALDREMQVVLLLLRRLAGLDRIRIDANSPAASYWNAKAPLHPTVADARTVAGATSPDALLAAETAHAPLARRLGLRAAVVPGYALDADGADEAAFGDDLLAAAALLRERYALRLGCLKPSEAGAGAGIVPRLDLHDEPGLRAHAARVWPRREPYVLEAHVEYLRHPLSHGELRLAPSGHVRHGHVADGLTLQLTSGTSWQGNVYLDRRGSPSLGLATKHYDAIAGAIERLHEAFTEHGVAVVTAGFDYAVGRIGGVFGDEVRVALQDPNMSSHGAEYLRRVLDDLRAAGGPPYAATKVICPAPGQTLRALRERADGAYTVISAIPGRWGMIAAAATSPGAAAERVLAHERALFAAGAIVRVAPRSG